MLVIKLRLGNTEILSCSVHSIRVNLFRRREWGRLKAEHKRTHQKIGETGPQSFFFTLVKELSFECRFELKTWSLLVYSHQRLYRWVVWECQGNWPQTNVVPCIPRHLHDFLGVQSISVGHWWMISSLLLNGGADPKLIKEKNDVHFNNEFNTKSKT